MSRGNIYAPERLTGLQIDVEVDSIWRFMLRELLAEALARSVCYIRFVLYSECPRNDKTSTA
jgi:hypothetical protein